MYFTEKSEYNDIREKSFSQWLDEMEQHEDVAVRCGVKLAREYTDYLKEENEKLREEIELKEQLSEKAGTEEKIRTIQELLCGESLRENISGTGIFIKDIYGWHCL